MGRKVDDKVQWVESILIFGVDILLIFTTFSINVKMVLRYLE